MPCPHLSLVVVVYSLVKSLNRCVFVWHVIHPASPPVRPDPVDVYHRSVSRQRCNRERLCQEPSD